jgi:hypothetical protein
MKLTFRAFLAAGILACVQATAAPVLHLQASSSSAHVGDAFTVEVRIAGVADLAAPSVGVYDLDLTFDAALVAPGAVTFGVGLDVLGLGSIRAAAPGVGVVNLFELSLDTVDDLNALQAGEFVLAIVGFTALADGLNTFDLLINSLGDAEGVAIPDVSVTTAQVQIRQTNLPEPISLALVLVALGLAASLRRPGLGCHLHAPSSSFGLNRPVGLRLTWIRHRKGIRK